MLSMLRDLVAHKGRANAVLLNEVRGNEGAAADPGIIDLLQHVLVANRFWICAIRRAPFVPEREAVTPRSCGALVEMYRNTQDEEGAWLSTATEADCVAILDHPLIPGGQCSVAQAFMQICMHSQGHRAQLARMLRARGMAPPQTDFITWLIDRKEPEWR